MQRKRETRKKSVDFKRAKLSLAPVDKMAKNRAELAGAFARGLKTALGKIGQRIAQLPRKGIPRFQRVVLTTAKLHAAAFWRYFARNSVCPRTVFFLQILKASYGTRNAVHQLLLILRYFPAKHTGLICSGENPLSGMIYLCLIP